MTQEERLDYLISRLLKERENYDSISVPKSIEEKRILLRSLFNIRPPVEIDEEFLKIQDEYLKERNQERGIVSLKDLLQVKESIYLFKGDITTLKVDAIVNAANSELLGCFIPCHHCIDNAIHTYAGVQLRLECHSLMSKQGHPEEIGKAKITKAYNLPSSYVIHTVGPFIYQKVTDEDREALRNCYLSCLNLALEHTLKSIAFCSISTGEFHFPKKEAAIIAVKTVTDFLKDHPNSIKVIFDVFTKEDKEIYEELLN